MSQVIINLFVISTSHSWQHSLVEKLTNSGLYKHSYTTSDGQVVNVIEWEDNSITYHIHIHTLSQGILHVNSNLTTQGNTVITILYDTDDRDSLQLANTYIKYLQLTNPTASVLLVAVENRNSKHLIPSATYSVNSNFTSFTERNIRRHKSGSSSGTMGNFIYLVVEEVKNQTRGNAIVDINVLMNKMVKGKHKLYGWNYYGNINQEIMTDDWFEH